MSRGGVCAVGLAASFAAFAVFGGLGACFFSLADVSGAGSGDGGGVGEGGSADGAPAEGGAGEGGGGDASPGTYTAMGTACSGGRVTSVAVTASDVYVACATSGFSTTLGSAGVGAIVSAPRTGSFTASAPLATGEALAATATDVFFHGCGVEKIAGATKSVVSVSTTTLTAVSATTIDGTNLLLGGRTNAGLFDVGTSQTGCGPGATLDAGGDASDGGADAAACASDPGCTNHLAAGLAAPAGAVTGMVPALGGASAWVCTDQNHGALVVYGGANQGVPYTDSSACLELDVPLGIGAHQGHPYFASGNEVHGCTRVNGAGNCALDSVSTESGRVTLVTSSDDDLYWVTGSTTIRRAAGTSLTKSTVVTAPSKVTALAVLSGGAIYWGDDQGRVFHKP